MNVNGEMLISGNAVKGMSTPIHAIKPSTNQKLEPAFGGETASDVDTAAKLGWKAFDIFRGTDSDLRAQFLEACANEILALGEPLIERAMAETGLPKARIEGECGRTIG